MLEQLWQKKSRFLTVIKKAWKQVFVREYLLFLLFVISNIITSSLWVQAVALIFYIIALYLINKDVTKTLWLAFWSTVVFDLSHSFAFKFTVPTIPWYLDISSYEVYSLRFSDPILLFLLFWLKRSGQKVDLHFGQLDRLLILILILMLFSGLISPHFGVAIFNFFLFCKFVMVFYLSRCLFWKKDYARITIHLILTFAWLNAILILLQRLNGGPLGLPIEETSLNYGIYASDATSLYRPGGMFWDANFASAYLALITVFVSILLLTKQKVINRVYLFCSFYLFLIAIILSASRGSWLVLLIVMIFFFIVEKRGYSFHLHYIKLKSFLPILFIILLFSNLIIARFRQLLSLSGISSMNTRLVHTRLGALIAQQYPLGSGLNTFQYQIMQMFEPAAYLYDSTPSHTMLGELLGDCGFLITFLFLLFLYLILRNFFFSRLAIKNSQDFLKLAAFFLICAYLLLAEIYPIFFSFRISVIFWLFLGIIYEKKSEQYLAES